MTKKVKQMTYPRTYIYQKSYRWEQFVEQHHINYFFWIISAEIIVTS